MVSLVANHVPTDRLLQSTFDAAVVIPTVLRPTLERAVRSVFAQKFPGRIQVLVGVDRALGDRSVLDRLRAECPANCVLSVLELGYSTSIRNGGLYPCGFGGALRTILSYAANSPAVAYLDDDNWFADDHIRTLREALDGHDYAFSNRWYAERETGRPLCVDEWESVGPGAGFFLESFGGYVDTNCLMLDKLRCDAALRWWCAALPDDARGGGEDRFVFHHLRKHHRGRGTGLATAYYVIGPEDDMHPFRLGWINSRAAEADRRRDASPGEPRA